MKTKNKKAGMIKNILFLNAIIPLYSLSVVCLKAASMYPFLSLRWVLLYGGVIAFLGTYALLWQQVLKRVPLNIAYGNKAISIIWGMTFGVIIFKETLKWNNVLGALIVLCGVLIMVINKAPDNNYKELD